MSKPIELISDEEFNAFVETVKNNKVDSGNKIAIKKKSNLNARLHQLEQDIKDYIKKYAGTTAFDPCEFGKMNTEYFNLRFRLEGIKK